MAKRVSKEEEIFVRQTRSILTMTMSHSISLMLRMAVKYKSSLATMCLFRLILSEMLVPIIFLTEPKDIELSRPRRGAVLAFTFSGSVDRPLGRLGSCSSKESNAIARGPPEDTKDALTGDVGGELLLLSLIVADLGLVSGRKPASSLPRLLAGKKGNIFMECAWQASLH